MHQLSDKDKRKLFQMISVARKALQSLEDELVSTTPVRRKVDNYKDHFDNTIALGTWGKPAHLKKCKAIDLQQHKNNLA